MYSPFGWNQFVAKTDRYIDMRPTDAILWGKLTGLAFIGQVVFLAAWSFGCVSIPLIVFTLLQAVAFPLPTIITVVVMEILLYARIRA